MRCWPTRRGGFSLIVVIVAMMVFSTLGILVTSLVSSDSDVALKQMQSEEAFYLAEAGKEYAIRQILDGNPVSDCSVGVDTVSLGSGAFDVCQEPSGVPGSVRIHSTGRVASVLVGTVRRVTETIISPAGSTEALTDGDFEDTPNLGVNWPETLKKTDGQSVLDTATFASPVQSLRAENTVGAANTFEGYREQALAALIPANTPITLKLSFRKQIIGSTTGGSRADIGVSLRYATGVVVEIWSDTGQIDAGWSAISPVSFTPPNDVVAVRVTYVLRNRGGGAGAGSQKMVWFDAVSLTYGAGAPAVLSWKDVYS